MGLRREKGGRGGKGGNLKGFETRAEDLVRVLFERFLVFFVIIRI